MMLMIVMMMHNLVVELRVHVLLTRIIIMMNMGDHERMMIDAAVDVDKNEDL